MCHRLQAGFAPSCVGPGGETPPEVVVAAVDDEGDDAAGPRMQYA